MREPCHGARRLQAAFAGARSQGRAALIPYVTAGDPDVEFTKQLVSALAEAGADIVEIGVPFSDPLADGPTIQRSGQRALAAGTTTQSVFDAIRELRDGGLTTPVVLLAYYNGIYRRGEQRFMVDAAEAGADGVVTPDLPPEEARSLREAASAAGVALIPLVAPTSTPERLQLIGRGAQGFMYCVSVTGVTGTRRQLPDTLPRFLARVRKSTPTSLPLALGFGISDAGQARAAAALADGVIVGSALVQRLEQAPSRSAALQRARTFISELRAAATKGNGEAGAKIFH